MIKIRIMLERIALTLLLSNSLLLAAMATDEANGKATVYSNKYQGKKTATGERYDKNGMTAASPTLPLGSKVVVKNKQNGRTATVKINDRETSGGGKVVDLSKSAANKLGVTGTAPVTSKVVSREQK